MSNRARPLVVSTRTTRAEKALIRVAAEAAGMSVSDLVHGIVLPAVTARVSRSVEEFERQYAEPATAA